MVLHTEENTEHWAGACPGTRLVKQTHFMSAVRVAGVQFAGSNNQFQNTLDGPAQPYTAHGQDGY